MAGKKLAVNVAVRNPESGEVVVLEEGSEVPSWASDMVDDHVFEADEPKPARSSK